MIKEKWKSVNVSKDVYIKLVEISSKESIKRGKKISINDVIKGFLK